MYTYDDVHQRMNRYEIKVWNSTLADTAKNWVKGCNFTHSGGSGVPGFVYVGENLGAGQLLDPIVTDTDLKATFLETFGPSSDPSYPAWSDENKSFTYPSTCSGVCGHYTQVMFSYFFKNLNENVETYIFR